MWGEGRIPVYALYAELWEKSVKDDYDLYDRIPPHVKDSDTSRAAAESQIPTVMSLQSLVLLRVLHAGRRGLTCDEIEEQMSGRHQTISARVRELVQLGRIRDLGLRRKTRSGRNARVYVATGATMTNAGLNERDAMSPADYSKAKWGE